MRKLALVVAALASGVAFAGEYHSGTTNICADCHTMHGSMAHDYAGNTNVSTTPKAFADGSWLPASGMPADHLLKGSRTAVCVACHDGQNWAPDVVGPNTNNAYVRSAGFIPNVIHNGHTMGFSGTAPGGLAFTSFTCADCHAPHGLGDAFRNLNADALYGTADDQYPRYYLSATPFDPAGAARNDVRVDATYAPGTGPAAFAGHVSYYARRNVHFENGDESRLDAFCGKCHGLFHNNGTAAYPATNTNQIGTSATAFKRHPTRVLISTPIAGGFTTRVYAKDANRSYVGCLSCHQAHGTDNPFGLFYATAAVAGGPNVLDDSESGTGTYGGSCSNCHGQAQN